MHNHELKKINSKHIRYKTEKLLTLASNRYKVTVQIANRAKRKKYEDIDIIDDPLNKPIIRAILEMVDELNQSEIITD
uniref:DNA-directed RNA polymerase subunit omega n=1 Tax=Crouania attenuata TaxID=42002 RepID=A0A4D6WS16_9FLOR|nr:putative DNA-directed RNA polymerase subunit omega [Crouania attenuata]